MHPSLSWAMIFLMITVGACQCRKKSQHGQLGSEGQKKTITIGLSQEPDTLFMPFIEMMASEEVVRVGNHTLTVFDKNWRLIPWAAKEIPTLENGKLELFKENGKTKMRTTWEIRDEFNWPDGKPLTADDFVFGFDVWKDPSQEIIDRTVVEKVEKMEAKGANRKTLVVTWSEPFAYYHNYRQHGVLPKHLLEKEFKAAPEKFKKLDFGQRPMFAGSYTIKDWVPGSHIIAVRNPQAKGFLKPKIDEIVFRIIPQTNTLESNLVSGTIDAISPTGMSIEQAMQFEERHSKDYTFYYTPGLIWEHIDFNLDNEILKDKRVRQALTYGANREGMAKALFKGKQPVAHATESPKSIYYNPDVRKYHYDVGAAAKLLDEAGWKLGPDGMRTKNGVPLALTIMSTSGNKPREQIEQLLQSDWKKIGVELEIRNQPAKILFGDTLRRRKFPHLAMYSWLKDPIALSDTLWRCDYIPRKENNFMGQNQPGWCNKEVDQLLKAASQELDEAKRIKMAQRVEAIWAEELPSIPLYFRSDVSAARKELKHWEQTGTLQAVTWNAHEWTWEK